MKIGDKVHAVCRDYDMEGVVVSGQSVETGRPTKQPGDEVDADGFVRICDDEGEKTLNGWLWEFEVTLESNPS